MSRLHGCTSLVQRVPFRATEYIVRDRRRFIAVSLLGCVLICGAVPSTAFAGPLLDWLFHRNRSESLARTTANYPNATRTRFGSCLDGLCPFGRGRSGLASRDAATTNDLAANQNLSPTTTSYPPAGSCGPGWCQQTVVRYVPQIAYRTAYQPVPVTTYKTSTTINPENGLPRTCTRPCTSYTYQARRVPYTTYRPVYTTVPVADTLSQTTTGYAPQSPPAASIAPSLTPQTGRFSAPPNYSYQPPPTCSGQRATSTQTGAYAPYGASTIPGYTPGNATSFPPAPQTGSWPNATNSTRGVPAATPWRPANELHRDPPPGTNPWQEDDGRSPPSEFGYGQGRQAGGLGGGARTEADNRPSLRPEYSDDYSSGQANDSYSPSTRLKPVPMPESIRRRFDEKPRRTPNPSPTDDDVQARSSGEGDRTRQGHASTDDNSLFLTPNRSAQINLRAPLLDPPANQDSFGPSDVEESHYDSRALRDFDPDAHDVESPRRVDLNDKTAMARASHRRGPRGTRPVHERERVSASRYASVPIQWPARSPTRTLSPAHQSGSRWRSN